MDVEDILQVNTCFGKKIIGFILKKFLEKKFGVEFDNFEISKLNIYSYGADKCYNFSTEISCLGHIYKTDLEKLIQGGIE